MTVETSTWQDAQRKQGRQLRAAAVGAGVKLADVAEAMGINPSDMSRYLHGRREWDSTFVSRFHAALEEAGA